MENIQVIILATSRIRWHSTASDDPMNEAPLLVVFFIHCDRALLVWNKTCSSPTTSSFRPCTANASAWDTSSQEILLHLRFLQQLKQQIPSPDARFLEPTQIRAVNFSQLLSGHVSLKQPTSPPSDSEHCLSKVPWLLKMHLFCWGLQHQVTVAFRGLTNNSLDYTARPRCFSTRKTKSPNAMSQNKQQTESRRVAESVIKQCCQADRSKFMQQRCRKYSAV